MLYKYCPKCFSINVKFDSSINNHKCNTCGYEGEMKSDSIDKINLYKKQGTTIDMNFKESKTEISAKKEDLVSIKERIKNKFKDKVKNPDWELV